MGANGAGKGRAKGTEAAAAATSRGSDNADGDPKEAPRSLSISQRGVKTGEDFANLMSALMADVIDGRLSPVIANATVNAGGKLLKVVEMQYRYGKEASQRSLLLAPGE